MRFIIIWVLVRKSAQKMLLVAVAVRWNRPSEGAALKNTFNDSGIRSYADRNIEYNRRNNICIFTDTFVPIYFSCLEAGLDVIGGCA